MKSTTHEARGFVKGVLTHLKKSTSTSSDTAKVQTFLFKMSEKAKHEHAAVVTSAVKLNDIELSAIADALSKAAGAQIALENKINKELLGGFRIQMADWVMDTSLKGQLEQMAHILVS